ncbi:MAG: S1 RNA-binding domain-containing protein [Candidatus Gastranaerophilaceae bacterium]
MATKKKDAIPDEEMLLEQQAIAEEQPLSQTGSDVASEEVSRAEESPPAPDESPAPQTDSENTDSERIPAEDALDPPASIADSQTETEAAEKPAEGPAPARRTRKTRSKKSESDAEPEKAPEHASDGVEGEAKPRRRRAAPRPASAVVAIDDRLGVETEADKARNDLLDLVESLKTKRILTGTIQGVERPADNPSRSLAVIYHGDYKIIIPAEEAVEPPSDFRGRLPEDVLHYMVTKRLGAEIDFIVKGIDGKAGLAVGSRLEAMAAKRREYYFGSDRDGNNLLYEGICAEARVVSVIRAGIFVDLFGLEVYIPLRELSYQRMLDASSAFQPGQRILVKILSIDRSDRAHPKVSASIKQAGENPYEKALRRYTVGNRYVGTVSMVDMNGVFVALDGGIDCLCSYPKRGRPPRGARVTVRILGINNDSNRIWGAITHIATPR